MSMFVSLFCLWRSLRPVCGNKSGKNCIFVAKINPTERFFWFCFCSFVCYLVTHIWFKMLKTKNNLPAVARRWYGCCSCFFSLNTKLILNNKNKFIETNTCSIAYNNLENNKTHKSIFNTIVVSHEVFQTFRVNRPNLALLFSFFSITFH